MTPEPTDPGYLTKQERITIEGAADLVMRSLLDRQQFADPSGAAERLGISTASWPMFGLLWPSGAELAALLMARPRRRGERILEVGCGLGLASLAAHRRGDDITASDCHPLAEAFLRTNLRLNDLPPMKYRHGQWATSTPAEEPSGESAGDVPAARLHGRFDLVVGSDLLYERDDEGGLAAFIDRHAEPSAEVWIVDPDRGNRPAFVRRMADAGFMLREQRLDRVAAAGKRVFKGRLLAFRRGHPFPTLEDAPGRVQD